MVAEQETSEQQAQATIPAVKHRVQRITAGTAAMRQPVGGNKPERMNILGGGGKRT